MMAFAVPSHFNIKVMIEALGKGRFSAPWSRGAMGGWDAFVDHMSYFGYLLPTFSVMLARRRGWLHPMAVTGLLLTLIFLTFQAQSGSRRIVGATVGAALLYWIMDRKTVRVQHLAVGGVVVAGLIWLMQLMLYTRGEGFSQVGDVALRAVNENFATGNVQVSNFNRIHVDDNFYRLTQINMAMPNPHPFINLSYITYVLLRPIPRVFWPGKPTDSMFALHFITGEGASLSSSILGELYVSRGLLAIMLGGWLYGRLARLNAALFSSTAGTVSPVIYGYMTMWLFVGYRSMIELVLFTYPLLAWMVLSKWVVKPARPEEFIGRDAMSAPADSVVGGRTR